MKFRRIKMIVLTVAVLSLAACGNTPTPEQIAADDKAYSTDYGKYADNSKVAKINIKPDGSVASIEIGNQNLKAPTRKVYDEGLGKTLVKETFHTVRTVAGGNLAIAAVAIEGFKNGGTRNYDSNNSHSEQNQQNTHTESNQANQQTNTETVGGLKAGGNVDQSQHNQNNPVSSTTNTDDNSLTDSNNGGNDNSSTEIKEAEVAAAENEVE